jgi:hypothetical protein
MFSRDQSYPQRLGEAQNAPRQHDESAAVAGGAFE